MTDRDNKDSSDAYSQKNIFICAAAVCAAAGIIGSFFTAPMPLAAGLVFGLVINILCFRLLYIDCLKETGREPKKAKLLGNTGYLKRYIIKGFALYACTVNSALNFWGCAIGLVSIGSAVYLINFVQIIKSRKKG